MHGNETTLVRLDDHRLILARGADAQAFLQGQLSSDLRLLTAERAQLSSYNSPKGRMLAVLQLLRLGDAIALEVHASLADAALARLRKFVLRAKVQLELAAGPSGLGLVGPGAGDWLRARELPCPEAPQHCAHAGDLVVLRRHGAEPRYSLHGDVVRFADAAAADALAWRRSELLAGVPTVHAQTVDFFVPQMCNLDRLGGVSFDKGCYTGQEIVARLHFLGTLKRRMFLCHADAAPGGPGTPVYAAGGDGQAVGDIVDAVPLEDGRHAASVVLQIAHAQAADLRAGTPGGVALSVPMDYAAA